MDIVKEKLDLAYSWINFVFLKTGHAMAPVANCCKTKYDSQVKEDMSLKEFCDYWKNRSQEGKSDFDLTYLGTLSSTCT